MDTTPSILHQPGLTFQGQVLSGDAIFERGIAHLKEKDRGCVYIYAPTGVWKDTKIKLRWFETIADCLANWHDDDRQRFDTTTTTKLMSFIGVFGLPPIPKNDDVDGIRHFDDALNIMEKLFMPFNALETAHIHYLRTDTATIPGTGAIIIDDSAFVGFAVTGRFTIDYGMLIHDQPEVVRPITSWFTQHVMNIVVHNTIQDVKEGKTVKHGINEFRKRFNLPACS